MKKPLTLTEQAVIKLNHIALSLHHTEFQNRMDRLVDRLTGNRQVVEAEVVPVEGQIDWENMH